MKRYIVSLLALCLFSCTERIDINTEASEPHLVIYGYITSDTTRHEIRITRSSSYFATSRPEGISHADVRISSGDSVFVLTENPSEAGLYQTQGHVYGIEGESYTLSVSLDFDEDGAFETYEATSFLPYAPEVDSIDFRDSDLIDKFIEVLLWGRLPEQDENYLSFHIYRNDKQLTSHLEDYFVIDDEYLDKKEIIGISCFYLDQEDEEEDDILEEGDYITVRVDGITKEYATFIENAQSELWGSDPLFSGPPANLETNIQCKTQNAPADISGFFTAFSGRRTSRVYHHQ
ncbi:hypothetical protein M2459_001773 [Parabacteroides sp. PF5-5]|uniref:DUF4249 family protein n=1 Tax=unclassified Parabacteroides TaxID=2649774 RepID=UPI002473490F|nr:MULTISPECIES: DUF4249 family protein [unclassified Parabacteroides]MDH6305036.1 hypothetical protein [Parabacteroides sp. PH5-39]MDH6315879.1 hypothetical protein [Parabacteroides sp. PF5-13]MDH6319536.1 hypothetical protein [Parabacteroides sp. PH5-13]MDH6323267.1 hypothetical protein [Parabacteroides sp. PH5-8]MDH6327225.1 hypothetical protein [Parabacteroides sp. PH5-41]